MPSVLRVVVLVPLLAVLGLGSAAAEPGSLPDDECLRVLRRARIAQLNGDPAAELAHIRDAMERFPDELAPLYAILDYHRRHPLDAEEHGRLKTRLLARLEGDSRPVSLGLVGQMASDPKIEDEVLESLAAHLEARLQAAVEGESPPPGERDGLRLLAGIRERLGRNEAALEALERLWAIEPSEELVWPFVRLYRALEKWPELAEVLGWEIERHGGMLRSGYVEALIGAGRVEEAMEQLAIVETEIEDAGAFARMLLKPAWDLRDRGHHAQAERLFRKVVELEPENADARAAILYLYGTAEERQAHAAALAEKWQQEEDPNALFDQGTQRLTAGDARSAYDLLARAAPQLPDLEAAWYNLGMAAYRLERWQKAAEAFGHASRLNPGRPQSYYFRGISLHKLELCQEAVEVLATALELDPGRSQAHYYLSGCYQRLGNAAAAREHMNAYQAAKP